MLEDIIRGPIFYQISLFGLQIAVILYQLENVSDFNSTKLKCPPCRLSFQDISVISFNLVTDVSELSFFALINFILCYIITTSTTNTLTVGDIMYGLHWYRLSHIEQFLVQTMIQRSQNQFEIKGLGVFVCSLETYLRVRV